MNAQSRVIEDMLVRQGIGYRVIGGTKFYQRAEIKDLLAYLRVTLNATDDLSLLRVINTRGGAWATWPSAGCRSTRPRTGSRCARRSLHAEECRVHGRGRQRLHRVWARTSSAGTSRSRGRGRRRHLVRTVLEESGLVDGAQGRADPGGRGPPGEPGGVRGRGPGVRPA